VVGLTLRKDRASRPAFLGAEASEAEVRMLLLVLMGDILSPGGSDAELGSTLRKDRASRPAFLWAERHKAKACKLQLPLMA
jgi:hypothetical protein